MSHSRDERSPSPNVSASPDDRRHRSRSRSRSRSPPRASRHSRSRSPEDVSNPGNNLYVTGLSTRVTVSDLEKFFSKEGKVVQCSLVTDPHTKESRGFGFVTMETTEDAERCIKYLNRTVLEGRLVTVEKVCFGGILMIIILRLVPFTPHRIFLISFGSRLCHCSSIEFNLCSNSCRIPFST